MAKKECVQQFATSPKILQREKITGSHRVCRKSRQRHGEGGRVCPFARRWHTFTLPIAWRQWQSLSLFAGDISSPSQQHGDDGRVCYFACRWHTFTLPTARRRWQSLLLCLQMTYLHLPRPVGIYHLQEEFLVQNLSSLHHGKFRPAPAAGSGPAFS